MLSQSQYETPGLLLVPLPGIVARRHPLFIYAHSPVKPNTLFGSHTCDIPQAALF
jgi:hypothetical protein